MRSDIVSVAELTQFDSTIDVRSPAEFAEDRLPGAISCPVLDDDERARVGTLYKQESPFAARKIGAVLVARNIARYIESRFLAQPRTWRPLVYCWRGGQRSGAMVTILRQIGWDAKQLDGGYKAFRRAVIADLTRWPSAFRFRVLCGLTGSGKTRLLRALPAHGGQILDLEALAVHRGSLLGDVPASPQPSQKAFETAIRSALAGLDRTRPVFVESESRRIGALRLPETLVECMRASPCLDVRADLATRVALLKEEYRHFLAARSVLAHQLEALLPLHGHEIVGRWRAWIHAGEWDALVADLLMRHYDPAYTRSIGNHFPAQARASAVQVRDASPATFDYLAAALVREPVDALG